MSDNEIEIRLLGCFDLDVLKNVAADVFDEPVDVRWSEEFLNDPRHHLAVAIDQGQVVGMASAVNYVHPDKAPVLWINEVGVAPSHHQRGIGKALMARLFECGRELGCGEAWVATEPDNIAAQRLYEATGGQREPEPFVMFNFLLQERD